MIRRFLLALIVASGGLTFAQPSFKDFSSVAGLNLIGVTAQYNGNTLRLTPSTMEVYGAAWYSTKQYVKDGYVNIFKFQITDTSTGYGAGNGFSFTFQNDNASQGTAVRASYYEVGDAQIVQGVCVEFRMGSKEGAYGTIPENSVSVHTNGSNSGNAELGYPAYSIGSATLSSSMKDGSVHTAMITYVPGTMKVYVDDMNTEVLKVNIDFGNISGTSVLDASGQMWIGFTGGTCGNSGAQGPCYEAQDILSWSTLFVDLTNDTVCSGSAVKIQPRVLGGAKPLSYSWTPSTGLDNPSSATPIASPGTTTKYKLTVTDANGLKSVDSLYVVVHPRPTVDAGNGMTLCLGSTGTLQGSAASGGSPPYTYQWSPTKGLGSPTALTTTATPDTTTTYYLTASDAYGCTAVDSVIVKVNQWPKLSTASNGNLYICDGDTVTIGGPATGNGPFTYKWNPPTGLTSTTIAAPVASPHLTTAYTVVVTDKNGCTNQGTVTINVSAIPHPRILYTDTVLCAGDTTVLKSTDSNYASVRWSTGDTTRQIKVWKSGTYTVTAKGQTGCLGTSQPVTVTVLPRPTVPVVTASGPLTLCPGQTVILSAPIAGYSSWKWNSGETQPSIVVKTAGTYIVTVTGSNGCSISSQPVVVTAAPTPAPVITGPVVTCINARETYAVSDSATFHYKWTATAGGTIVGSDSGTSITVQWSGAGPEEVDVTETNSGGCSGSGTLKVTVSSALKPLIAVTGDTVMCQGDSVILDAGAGYTSYQWSSGETTRKITVTQQGAYAVHVADASGCSGTSDSVHVTVGKNLTPTLTGPDTVCSNSTVTYRTTPAAGRTYAWTVTGGSSSNGTSSDSIVVVWGSAGAGSLNINIASGACIGAAAKNIVITDGTVPVITASGPTTFCTGDSVILSAPTGMKSYQWSTGDTTQSITITYSGTFTVRTQDSRGCWNTSLATTVSVGSSLVPVVTGALAFCAGDSTTLDAGGGYSSYLWNSGETSQSIVVRSAGTFHVTVTRGNCSGTSLDYAVNVNPLPTPAITVSGDTLTSSPAATYQWQFNGAPIAGETKQSTVALQPGAYAVRVTDTNGCSGVSSPVNYAAAPMSAIVAVGTIPQVNPGTTVEIPILLVSSQNMKPGTANHYVGALRYNGSMLIPDRSRGGVLGGSQGISGSTDRMVTFEGYRDTLTAGTLQWIQCEAVLGNDTCTTVTIDTLYWTDAAVTVSGQSGLFCESGLCVDNGGVRRISSNGTVALQEGRPNPATDEIVFDYSTVESGATQIEIRDMMGRIVRSIDVAPAGTGAHTLTVPVRALGSGCYVCVLRTPTLVLRQLFLVKK